MFTIKEIERQARGKLLDTYEDNYRFKPTCISCDAAGNCTDCTAK